MVHETPHGFQPNAHAQVILWQSRIPKAGMVKAPKPMVSVPNPHFSGTLLANHLLPGIRSSPQHAGAGCLGYHCLCGKFGIMLACPMHAFGTAQN